MSRVFLATENRFQRPVVIKVLSPELAAGLSSERFEREIGLAATLQQANSVPVISAGEVNGAPWFSMPYVDGESLRMRMQRGLIPTVDAIAILRDVLRALAYAHERGIVHRDIKPENILLSGDAAVVTDFGIAKALSASKTSAPGGTLTQIGTSLGTPAYMAPEQAVGSEVDHRADIFSWGVLAYELLSGQHPFASKTTAQQLVAAHIAEEPRALPASLPAASFITRALSKNPDDRPSSAKSLIDALNNVHTAGTPVRRATSRKRVFAVGGAIVAIVVAVFLTVTSGRDERTTAADTTPITTLAVLPFVNIGGDEKDEYFSDGMTDELANALSRLPGLRLAGRSSSFSFKGKSANANEVGKTLDVAGIIEGTVRRSGDRLRVTASLTSTVDGKQRWTESYERNLNDVFTVQDELTKAIVTALAPALRGDPMMNVAEQSRGTRNLKAYDDYLQGRHLWQERGTQNLLKSIELFKRAIDRDSTFARAYAGMAMSYLILPGYSPDPGHLMHTAGMQAARDAMVRDSTLVDARLALAYGYSAALEPEKAESLFLSVVQQAPQYATARQWRAGNLLELGRIDEAIEELRRATAIDPVSSVIQSNLVYALWAANQMSEAQRELQRVFAIDPEFVDPSLMSAYIFNAQPDSALYHLRRMQREDASAIYLQGMFALAYAASGKWSDYDGVITRLRNSEASRGSMDLALAELAGGNREPMAQLLATDNGKRLWASAFIVTKCAPWLAPLRDIKELAAFVGERCTPLTWPIRPRNSN